MIASLGTVTPSSPSSSQPIWTHVASLLASILSRAFSSQLPSSSSTSMSATPPTPLAGTAQSDSQNIPEVSQLLQLFQNLNVCPLHPQLRHPSHHHSSPHFLSASHDLLECVWRQNFHEGWRKLLQLPPSSQFHLSNGTPDHSQQPTNHHHHNHDADHNHNEDERGPVPDDDDMAGGEEAIITDETHTAVLHSLGCVGWKSHEEFEFLWRHFYHPLARDRWEMEVCDDHDTMADLTLSQSWRISAITLLLHQTRLSSNVHHPPLQLPVLIVLHSLHNPLPSSISIRLIQSSLSMFHSISSIFSLPRAPRAFLRPCLHMSQP